VRDREKIIVSGATLSRQRRFILPLPGDSLAAIAARELPGLSAEDAMQQLEAWNLHIFLMRRPAGLLTGCDVVFVEPPLAVAV
jgi:hypothetical protein